MKKITLAVCMLFFALGAVAQNNLIYSTTFPAGDAPFGWSTQILAFEGETDWYFGDTYLPGSTFFSAPAAMFNDDISFDEHSNVRLISPSLDVSGYETVNLSFEYGLSRADNSGTLNIEVFNGTSWTQIMFVNTNVPPQSTGDLDMTQYKNSQFQVRYTYDDQFGNSWGAGITNFKVEGTYDVIPNDLIENAFALSCGQTSVGTTVTSTAKTGLPVCNGVDGNTHGVWYKFSDVMNQSEVTLSLCDSGTDFDSRVSVFKGATDALTCVTANDDSCGTLSSVTFDYDGFSDYYVLVSGAGDTTGAFTIAASCTPTAPPNDEIANAYDVDSFPQPYTDHAVQFTYATPESQAFDYEVNGCDGGGMPYVWYKFTATANGTAHVVLPTPSPGGLNIIHFYSAPNENATVPDIDWVNQASNACNAMDDDRQIDITEGTTYYVAITLEGGNSDVAFTITYTAPCVTPDAPTGEDEQSFTAGETVTDLEVDAIDGATLKWYIKNDADEYIAITADAVLEDATTYYVTQTVGECESTYFSIAVTYLTPCITPDAPTGEDEQSFTTGDTVADLEVNVIDGTTLKWYVKNDADEYVAITDDAVLENGMTYYVTQTVGECESSYFPITVNQIAGLNNANYTNLKVYPNPVNNVVTIANGTAISKVTVTNMLGQTVITRSTDAAEVQLDLSGLQQGTYVLQLEAEGSSASVKIVKL